MGVLPHLPVQSHHDTTRNFEMLQKLAGNSFGRNIKEFGAQGNGGDDTNAFRLAHEAVQAEGGNIVFVPAGTYGITHLHYAFPNFEEAPTYLVGAGRLSTILKKVGTGTEPMITYGEHGAEGLAFVTSSPIRAMTLRGNKECHGLEMEKCAWFELDDLSIEECDAGIFSRGSLTYEIANSLLRGNKTGFKSVQSFDGSIQSNIVTIRKCVISNNTSHGIDASASFFLNVDNCDIEQNGVAGNTATGGIVIREPIGAIGSLNRIGNQTWMEENYGIALKAEAGELVVDRTLFVNTDPATAATQGRDIFITGSVPQAVVEKCAFSRTMGEGLGKQNILVDHECNGAVRDCKAQPPILEKTAAPAFLSENEIASYIAQAPQITLAKKEAKPTIFFGKERDAALYQEASKLLTTDGRFRAREINMEISAKAPAAAANYDIFYNTETSKLCFKDAAGVVQALY